MPDNCHWWESYGPFDPDPTETGFPKAGQVIQHYRRLKKWSTTQLGEALGKSARWVQAVERENTVPEAISRRRKLAAVLGIPPALLGLTTIENGVPVVEMIHTTSAPKKASIDAATLEQYEDVLHLYWELDYANTAHKSILTIERQIDQFRMILPDAGGNSRRVVELMCRYHQLATWIARDQCAYDTAFAHANHAVHLAQSTQNSELLAAALFRRGRTSLEQGNLKAALLDLDAALPYTERVRPQLKGLVLLAAGHAHAHAIQTQTDRTQTMTLLDQAGRIVRRGHLEEDESFVKLNIGRYHLDKAGALLAMGRPTEALDELDLADRGVGPEQTRRHAYINVLRAQAYAQMREFSIALSTAQDALPICKAIKSGINIVRIGKLLEQIDNSKKGGSTMSK